MPIPVEVATNLPGNATVSTGRPNTTVLLVVTTAPDPIAVAKLRSSTETSALSPMIVLLEPVVFEKPDRTPKKELLPPVVLANPEILPKKELLKPVVLALPELRPKNEFSPPVVFARPESLP